MPGTTSTTPTDARRQAAARSDALHDALERLAGYGFVDGPGFACHGTMGAEALSSLGYDGEVATWVETYKRTHAPIDAPPAGRAIDLTDEASWRPALGDVTRMSDWEEAFRRALWDAYWGDVLRRWLPVLLPGHAGGLGHGLLRTAHAVRALATVPTPADGLFLDELARGLGSWAGWSASLPGRPALRGALGLDDAIRALPRPAAPWTPIEAGTFSRLPELDGFTAAVDDLAPPAPGGDPLGALSAAFARIVPAGAGPAVQGLVHTVTPVAAMRALLPHVAPGDAFGAIDTVVARLWHAGAAIVTGFAPARLPDPAAAEAGVAGGDPGDLAARAVEHGDPHAVKFVEACLAEHRRQPDPAYLAAAAAVVDRLPVMGGRGG
ncbi:MAG TPA: hypothetical protein VFI47_22425 [Acidimicrobiales bacterium]|nr:hypothetical protein [Acidimicrobiales bacterium]